MARRILLNDYGWTELETAIGYNAQPQPWKTTRRHLEESGAEVVVLEESHLSSEYRSEWDSYLRQRFHPPPKRTLRAHFFDHRRALEDDFRSEEYLGYVNFRNASIGKVGEAVLRPPPQFSDAVLTKQPFSTVLEGRELVVEAVPFSQQDQTLGRCVHSSLWTCIAVSAARGIVAPVAMGALARSVRQGIEPGRVFPSSGLSVSQLSAVLNDAGLPPMFHKMGKMPSAPRDRDVVPDSQQPPGKWDTRVIPVMCRALNSGFPLVATTASHATAIVGYQRARRVGESSWFEFIRHDDETGPYRIVENVLADVDHSYPLGNQPRKYGPWSGVLIPFPSGLWLTPEVAERTAIDLHGSSALDEGVSVRTYALQSDRYKQFVTTRGFPTEIADVLRQGVLPEWLYAVEVCDRSTGGSIAEYVIDPTSPELAPDPLVIRRPTSLLMATEEKWLTWKSELVVTALQDVL